MPEYQQTQQSSESKSTVQNHATPKLQTPVSNPMAIIQRARINPKSLTPADILQLQRTIGNRAVGRLLSEIGLISSKPKQAPPVQMQKVPEEEKKPLQGMFAEPLQRQEIPEEEKPLKGKFEKSEQESCSSCSTLPIQQMKENRTGMSDNLKAGVENLSGIDMSDVRVHYDSDKPAKVGALAYTKGTDIHVAPGQERYLPHEAWHVVQQAQGRVQQTRQMSGVAVNDEADLEYEADVTRDKVRIEEMKSEQRDEYITNTCEENSTKKDTKIVDVNSLHTAALKTLQLKSTVIQFGRPKLGGAPLGRKGKGIPYVQKGTTHVHKGGHSKEENQRRKIIGLHRDPLSPTISPTRTSSLEERVFSDTSEEGSAYSEEESAYSEEESAYSEEESVNKDFIENIDIFLDPIRTKYNLVLKVDRLTKYIEATSQFDEGDAHAVYLDPNQQGLTKEGQKLVKQSEKGAIVIFSDYIEEIAELPNSEMIPVLQSTIRHEMKHMELQTSGLINNEKDQTIAGNLGEVIAHCENILNSQLSELPQDVEEPLMWDMIEHLLLARQYMENAESAPETSLKKKATSDLASAENEVDKKIGSSYSNMTKDELIRQYDEKTCFIRKLKDKSVAFSSIVKTPHSI